MYFDCGQCVGCRMNRASMWTHRIMHHARFFSANSFATLTYNDANLPADGGLDHRHFQLWMKRFRKLISPLHVDFYMAGEYGSLNNRPHYHVIIFGWSDPDRHVYKTTRAGSILYRSPVLEATWQLGYSSIGDLTEASAGYTARYIITKLTGDMAAAYSYTDPATGEIIKLRPPYNCMSRRTGIGKHWIDKYMDDVYNYDKLISNGRVLRPPKYYDKQREKLDFIEGTNEMAVIKLRRQRLALQREITSLTNEANRVINIQRAGLLPRGLNNNF